MMRHRTALALTLLAGLTAPVLAQTPAPIGVRECDEFLTAYETCVNTNYPASARAMMISTIQQMRDAYRQSAQSPEGRAALAPQCTQMRQATAQSMTQYNCRF